MWIGSRQSDIVGMAAQFVENLCLSFEFVMILLRSHVIGFAYSVLLSRTGNQESPVIFAALGC